MAKIKNKKLIERRIKERFKEFQSDRRSLNQIGRYAISEIKEDGRNGIGFDGKPFPSLKASTIKRREALSEVNQIHEKFLSFFSNATFMGDTLNKIAFKVANSTIEIFGKGKHRYIIGVRGKRLKGSNANISDILKGLTGRGWKILGLNDRVRSFTQQKFIEFLKRKRR